ncbi:MAG: hypothetical protein ACYTFG_21785, partial [Planctomycetota bacterium]
MRKKSALLGLVILTMMVLMALGAPLLRHATGHKATSQYDEAQFLGPGRFAEGVEG